MQPGPQPSKPSSDPVLSIRIPSWIRDGVIASAGKQNTTPAEFVRQAIRHALDLRVDGTPKAKAEENASETLALHLLAQELDG